MDIKAEKPQRMYQGIPLTLVEQLLENARADTDLLFTNDSLGDDFSVARDVEFIPAQKAKSKS